MIQPMSGLRGSTGETDGPDRLKAVAQEFEAIFVTMLLKQARASARALSSDKPDMTRETYESWQDEHLAKAMSSGPGMGLADMLYRQLQQQR
jgi:flagellar protein FlgJ